MACLPARKLIATLATVAAIANVVDSKAWAFETVFPVASEREPTPARVATGGGLLVRFDALSTDAGAATLRASIDEALTAASTLQSVNSILVSWASTDSGVWATTSDKLPNFDVDDTMLERPLGYWNLTAVRRQWFVFSDSSLFSSPHAESIARFAHRCSGAAAAAVYAALFASAHVVLV